MKIVNIESSSHSKGPSIYDAHMEGVRFR